MDLEGWPPFESLDPVLDEVNDDLLSLETIEPGVMVRLGVKGESVADAVAERMAVSRVKGDIASSFLED